MTIAKDTTLLSTNTKLDTLHTDLGGTLKTQQQGALPAGTNDLGNIAAKSVTATASLSALNATTGDSTDVANFASVAVQVSGTFVGTVTYQVSNDGITWSTKNLYGHTATTPGSTTTVPIQVYGPLGARYFRATLTAFTSGTAVVTVVYNATPQVAGFQPSLATGANTVGNVKAGFLAVTGNIAALNGTVDGTNDLNTYASVRLQVTGTWVGTLTFETSVDGTNWVSRVLNNSASQGASIASTTTNALFAGDLAGRFFRVKASAWTSGTATITLLYSAAPAAVTPGLLTLNGGTTSLSGTAVKSASTAAVAADGALVVATSPNTPLPAGTNDLGNVGGKALTLTGTVAALNATIDGTTDLSGFGTARLQASGSWVASHIVEGSNDGTNWNALKVLDAGANTVTATIGANSIYWLPVFTRYMRIRAQSFTSGTASWTVVYSAAPVETPLNTQTILGTGANTIGRTGAASALVTKTITALADGNVDGTTDLSQYSSVRLQIVGPYVGTLQFQTSVDGTNWQTCYLQSTTSSAGGITNQLTAASPSATFAGPIHGRYFRLNNSAYTSGTAVVTAVYSTAPYVANNGAVQLAGGFGLMAANSVAVSGSLAALNGTVDGTTDLSAYGSVRVQITGTFSASYVFETSVDGTNWTGVSLATALNGTPAGNNSTIVSGAIRGRYFRVRVSAYTSGTVVVTILYSAVPEVNLLQAGIAAGNNTIGAVWINAGAGRSPSTQYAVTTASTNSTLVIASSRWIQNLVISNPTSTPAYLKIFNQATAPTAGTDILPRQIIPIPALGHLSIHYGPNGKNMSTGIAYLVTGGIGAADATNAVAGIIIEMDYV
jgi:hypothetical protein